jgi:tetratricopeptide (TPR) repeat protein
MRLYERSQFRPAAVLAFSNRHTLTNERVNEAKTENQENCNYCISIINDIQILRA